MAYELNGIEYPSVTTITGILDKPALLGWAAKCAVEHIIENMHIILNVAEVHRANEVLEAAKKAYVVKRNEAASHGTKTHSAIEASIQGLDPSRFLDTPESQAGFEAFKSWESKNHIKWLESEVPVFCTSVGYAGRFDVIALVNGHRYLIDFKTSSGIWPEFYWQVCAYRQAYNEMYPIKPVDNLAILHLDKEAGTPTFKPVEKDIDRMTVLFNSLVSVYYLLADRRLKNNPFALAVKNTEIPF